MDLPGSADRFYSAQGQELLCCSYLSDFVCRGRDWFGKVGCGTADRHMDAQRVCCIGDCCGRLVNAVLCPPIVAGKFSALPKGDGLSAAGNRTPAEWASSAMVCR